MSYENPPLPEGINVSRRSVLAETLWLGAATILIVAVVAAAVHFGFSRLARWVPFATEHAWVGEERVIGIEVTEPRDADALRIRDYLRELGGALAAHMDLPPGMQLHVHYTQSGVPNAFATLGGHVVVTSALYRIMPSENALATVLAHEIAHIRARDPIAALGGGASLALLIALVGGDAGALAPHVASIVQRGHSREAEALADAAALAAVIAHYGHAGGADAMFEALAAHRDGADITMPTLLSTHPVDRERIARMRAAAVAWDPAAQPLVALRVATAP